MVFFVIPNITPLDYDRDRDEDKIHTGLIT